MLVELTTGERIDIGGRTVHKYWNPQRLFKNCVFVMAESFDSRINYEGFAILTKIQSNKKPEWKFFWRSTVDRLGERQFKEGKFNNKEFIRINIDRCDGTGEYENHD